MSAKRKKSSTVDTGWRAVRRRVGSRLFNQRREFCDSQWCEVYDTEPNYAPFVMPLGLMVHGPDWDFDKHCKEDSAFIPANAYLIAAAPDLLEAAKHAAMEWRLHGQLTDSCRVLEAAIAKAEGR